MCDVDYDLSLAQRLLQSGSTSNKLAVLLAGASSVSIGSTANNNSTTAATIMDISAPQPPSSSSINATNPTASSNSNISTTSGSSAISDGIKYSILKFTK